MKKLRIWLLLISVTTSLVGADAAPDDESDQGLVLDIRKKDESLGVSVSSGFSSKFNCNIGNLFFDVNKDVFVIKLTSKDVDKKWEFHGIEKPLQLYQEISNLLLQGSIRDIKNILAKVEQEAFEPPIEEELVGKENSFSEFDETFVHDDSRDGKKLRKQKSCSNLLALEASFGGDAGACSSDQRRESTASFASSGSSGSIDSKTFVKPPNYLFKLCALFLAALFIQGVGQA